jgi:adenylyltransferase/sulfurtransferase
MDLSDAQLRRYARHIVLPEVGGIGQARLLEARVLVIGAGGLGAPLLLYLAAAGVGTLGVVDDDVVDASNLQRQVIHDMPHVGAAKTKSAAERIAALDPAIRVVRHDLRLGPENALEVIGGYDIVADGSDNFCTRALVQDACLRLGRTLVSASVQGLDGQLSTFKAHLGPPHPCLRCLFPDEPAGDALPSCAQGGVLGPAAGVMGCLQAVEVVKEILGMEEGLSGTFLLYDALGARIDRVRLARRPECVSGCVRLAEAAGADAGQPRGFRPG